MRKFLVVLIALVFAGLPALAGADSPQPNDKAGFALRTNGDYRLEGGDRVDTLVVVNGNAVIDGIVESNLIVIRGDATIRGVVAGNVQIVDGTVTLAAGSAVENVRLVSSTLTREPNSIITGDVTRSSRFYLGAGSAIFVGFLLLVGLGVTLMVMAGGFAAVGGRQLQTAAVAMTARSWQSIVCGVAALVVLPILAVIALASLVGFWIGLGLLLSIPVLTALGYVVSGTMLGTLMLGGRTDGLTHRPFAPAFLGTGVLLLFFAIPVVNVMALTAFGIWGVGALVYTALTGGHLAPPQNPNATTNPRPPAPAGQPHTAAS